ncbi:MAG: mechanosensitive ion channel [Phycisphaera sp.]|nr:mechanosensitive ion channel [Phycisphaera sp.]
MLAYQRNRLAAVVAMVVVSIGAFAVSAPTARAADAAAYQAVSTADPTIPPDQLKLLLMPMTKSEMEVEAQAWLELLKAKVHEISSAEIAVKQKHTEMKAVEKAAAAIEEAKDAADEAKQAADAAAAKGDTDAAKAAEDKAKQAAEKAKAAEKVTDAAKEAAAKTEQNADVKEATQKAVEKAVETAAEAAKDNPDAAAPVTPAQVTQPVEAPNVTAQDVKDPTKLAASAQAAKVAAQSSAAAKDVLLEHLTVLREERTALIDRFNVVLDQLEAKGGDPAEYAKYRDAVSGIVVDVTDATSTFKTIKGWVMSGEGGLRWALNLGKFIGILFAFWLLSIILGKVADKATGRSKRMTRLMRDFVITSVKRVTLALGLVIALSALEVNIGPVLAMIGGAAFIVGFALQGTLSNFASGIMILVYRPFDVDDVIDVSGVLGKVTSLNLVSTHVRTPDNKVVILPNNSVWGNVITNVTGADTRRVDMMFGIGYGSDMAKAQEILLAIIAEHELTLDDPAPVVQVHELADSSVNFVCRPWAKTGDYWTVYWDITRKVKERFDAEGVSIPFPQRDVHLFQHSV